MSESEYYVGKDRPDPPRTLRRIWLAGEIADVHKASGGALAFRQVYEAWTDVEGDEDFTRVAILALDRLRSVNDLD